MNNELSVNNAFYDNLGEDWWEANDHMIVFLREESKIKLDYLRRFFDSFRDLHILDIGSGAGFISLPLLKMGAKVTALDYSQSSLNTLFERAKKEKLENSLEIVCADATEQLNLKHKFDLVLAFDVLEHVDEPIKLVQNAANSLKPEGQFIYHTLNQSFWCWFLYLQLVPRLIKRDPGDVHRHKRNIKPETMLKWIAESGMRASEQIGMKAPFFQRGIWELISKREVNSELKFVYTKDLSLGYLGSAQLSG